MFSVFQSVCRSRGPRAGSFRASRLILLDPRLRTAPDSGRRGRVADVTSVGSLHVKLRRLTRYTQEHKTATRVDRTSEVRPSSVYSKTSRQ
jgi:hypothetical protein